MIAAAHFPSSLDRDLLNRVRRPLAAVASLLLVVDLIGLGLHLADANESPFADDNPSPARTRVTGPEAIVPGSEARPTESTRTTRTERAAEPYGCLSASAECYAGPPAPGPTPTTPPGATTPPPPPGPGTTPPGPVPVVQADIAAPDLGAQVSLGVGDGGCTTVNLTALAVGDCPSVSGEGPIVVDLRGALLGD